MKKTPRWGVRTLVFLSIAAASILTSNLMYAQGNDDLVLLTTIGTLIGLVGGAICTVRGLLALRRSKPSTTPR